MTTWHPDGLTRLDALRELLRLSEQPTQTWWERVRAWLRG